MKDIRILVVDNDGQRRANLKGLLGGRDMEVREAASSEEALQILASEPVGLVLTETELPGKSGLFLLQRTKELRPRVEVIMLSHNASSYNLLQALRNGAFDFIVRPIDSGEILFSALERVFGVLAERRRLGEETDRLKRSLKMMEALGEANERMMGASGIGELFLELLGSVVEELQARRGFLALIDPESGKLGLKVGRGVEARECRRYSAGLPPGLSRALVRHGEPVVIPGTLPEKLARRADPHELEYLYAAPGLLSAPLKIRDRVAGVVVISGHSQEGRFGPVELDFLVRLSRHAALALEKAGTIHRLRQQQSFAATGT